MRKPNISRDVVLVEPAYRQHDDHCWITFMGDNWKIYGVTRDCLLLVNEGGVCICDVGYVDWEAYCAMAVDWMYEVLF
jgi:hypothetical protein